MFSKILKQVFHIVFVRNLIIILVNNNYLNHSKNKYDNNMILTGGT